MAASDTLTTADLIRQGRSQEQYKLTSKDKDLIKQVQAKLKEVEMAECPDVDIIRTAREIGANADINAVFDAITSATPWTSVGGTKKTGRSESSQSRGPRNNQNRNGPRRDRTDATAPKGENTQTQNKQESGANEEVSQANGSEQRRGPRRDDNRRANGQENGSDRRGAQQNGRGERRGDKKEARVAEKPAPAPVVPVNTWASIVKGKTAEDTTTVVVSGKDQKPQGKAATAKRESPAAEAKSEAPAATTAATVVAKESTPAATAAAVVAAPAVQTETPKEVPAAEPAQTETASPIASANGHAATEKKDEASATGRNSGRNRTRGPRREKDSASDSSAVAPAGSAANNAQTAAAAATTEKSEAAPAVAVAAEPAQTTPAEKVIMPAAFSTTTTTGARRGFASSHVKVASNTPAAVAPVAAAPAPVAVAAPAPVEPVAAPAPVVSAPAAPTQAPATAPAPNTGSNPVATTVPPAITSSMPHMGAPHNQMHPGFPGMAPFGQFYTPDGNAFWSPEMFSHMPPMMYPPFMPPMAARGHDGKSATASNGATGSTNPNLNTQPPMGPMYAPYMPPMSPMYGYGYPGAPLQTQPPATSTAGSHNFGMAGQRNTYGAPRGPTTSYDPQEEFSYGAPRYDQYGSGGYHPQQHHQPHHGQEQKSTMSHDSNKMHYDDHHHHQYSSFGGPSFHQ